MVTDEFRELNKETRKTLVEREREKRKRRDPRGRRERERARQRARERERAQENRRARFLAMAFWLRRDDGLYTAQGPSPPWAPPTLMLGFWKITT
jgi:hypothetical protein